MLVDTGSSALAVCPGTNVGAAKATGKYGCGAYGDGYNGWVGQYFQGTATFGRGTEVVKDPTDITFALIKKENTDICTDNIFGIMGLDYGEDSYYNQEQKLPAPGGPETCGWSDGDYPGQFDKTLVVAEDLYTYALIGTNRKNSGDPVIAFGSTAYNLLNKSTNAGTASLSKKYTYWYAFSQPLTFQLHGYSSSTICASRYCSFTQQGTNADNVAISDSGTQQLVLPSGLFSNNFDPDNDTDISKLDDSMSVSIKVGTADITIPNIKQLLWDYDAVVENVPVLGFPVHWVYDVLFDIETDSSSAGKITFYERPGYKFEENKFDPSLRVHGKYPLRIPGSRRIRGGK